MKHQFIMWMACKNQRPLWSQLSLKVNNSSALPFVTCPVCVHIALVTQSCPTLGDPMDCSPPVSSVHGILQARYWSRLPFPSPGDLPDPGIEPGSPILWADSLPSEPPGKHVCIYVCEKYSTQSHM